jgi:hypothetical protein
MLTACILLFAMGLLGAFDIAWFHRRQARLCSRPDSRIEAWIHVARGVVYAVQFSLVPNARFGGAWYAAFVALFALDVAIAIADVLVEPASRRSLGGLPAGEYLAHVVLSVLAGAYLHALAVGTSSWRAFPSRIALEPHAPSLLRLALAALGAGSLLVALVEAIALLDLASPAPRPIHVSVLLRAPRRAVWDLTQDHRLHPAWDHRFSRIEMLDAAIGTGTRMRYEKDLLGLTIRGWGRYKLHAPLRQSTFEFGSDDVRSLIARGVGLWLYRDREGGMVEFSTSYTYEVRWGLFGRVFNRLVFRPLFQRETEQSFRRLARGWFPARASAVEGARGRKPARRARVTTKAITLVEARG